MINKLYILIGIILICGISCSRLLDIDPEQQISMEESLGSSENIQNLLVGAYTATGRPNYQGGYVQLMADLIGNSNQVTFNGTFQLFREISTKSILVNNGGAQLLWRDAYEVINISNLVIDNASIVVEGERDRVIGEARFLRALAYFELVRNFGQAFQPESENRQLGVPLSLTGIIDYTGNLTIARNTVGEVYNQVIIDLTAAAELLPVVNGVYADRYSVLALLSRVYLQIGNYAQARDIANDVIQNSGHVLVASYPDAFNNDANSTEDLFSIQVTSQGNALFGLNRLIEMYASAANGGRGGDVSVNNAYLALFNDENDVRSSFFYLGPQGRRLTSKYTSEFSNIALLRLAEQYLIRAESNFILETALGNTPLDDVNIIRNRAQATVLSLENLTISEIWNERERELAFEGFTGPDYIRTRRNIGELLYNDNRLVFPIPQRERDANILLVQNPGYGN